MRRPVRGGFGRAAVVPFRASRSAERDDLSLRGMEVLRRGRQEVVRPAFCRGGACAAGAFPDRSGVCEIRRERHEKDPAPAIGAGLLGVAGAAVRRSSLRASLSDRAVRNVSCAVCGRADPEASEPARTPACAPEGAGAHSAVARTRGYSTAAHSFTKSSAIFVSASSVFFSPARMPSSIRLIFFSGR